MSTLCNVIPSERSSHLVVNMPKRATHDSQPTPTVEERAARLDHREHIIDTREQLARERDRLADQRDELADLREAAFVERDQQMNLIVAAAARRDVRADHRDHEASCRDEVAALNAAVFGTSEDMPFRARREAAKDRRESRNDRACAHIDRYLLTGVELTDRARD
jgi:uncharacterized protein (DUF3084 family)